MADRSKWIVEQKKEENRTSLVLTCRKIGSNAPGYIKPVVWWEKELNNKKENDEDDEEEEEKKLNHDDDDQSMMWLKFKLDSVTSNAQKKTKFNYIKIDF